MIRSLNMRALIFVEVAAGLGACGGAPATDGEEPGTTDKPVILSEGASFECGGTFVLSESSCRFRSDGQVSAGSTTADRDFSVAVRYPSTLPGKAVTDYDGADTYDSANEDLSKPVVKINGCYGMQGDASAASTVYTPQPCTIQLEKISRGEITPVTASDGTQSFMESGSKVRIEVRCPEELYSPGADDYGPSPRKISPNEFVIEAKDCIVE